MKYATTEMKKKNKGLIAFISKFYRCGYHKQIFIDWLVGFETANEEELNEMSLPLIYCTYPQDCEDCLQEEINAEREAEGY